MENLLMGFNIVSTVFLVLLLGYFAKQRGHIDDNFVDKGTWIVFYLALPFKLFYDIKNARIESLHPKYVLYILLGVIFVIFLSLIIGKVIGIKDKRKLSAFVHCAYRSNFVYVGFPILDILYNGAPSMEHMIVIVSFGLTLYNISAIILLTYYSESEEKRISFLDIIVLAPLILIPTGKWLGFTNMELGIAYVFWATPCAANCFIFTRQMNSDYEFASKIITLSFIMSIVTYPVGISLMNYFNLLH